MSGILFKRIIIIPQLLKPTKAIKITSAAGICHKNHRDPEIVENKPKPWPYETKEFGFIDQVMLRRDRCVTRWDENTKVILVEGGLGVGKGKFGRRLAHELGMRFYPEPHLDDIYIRRDGFDYRSLNWMLPEDARYPDIKLAYMYPHCRSIVGLASYMYHMRYWTYMEALTHLFNTGEGVVIERSPWSNEVFLDAMWKCGYGLIDKPARDRLLRIKRETIWDLFRPHLVIYLDVPPEVQLQRVKDRKIDWEVNSEMTNLKYIQTMDDIYKDQVLPELANHAELLMYDWTEPGDLDLVIEDIEKLDYDKYVERGDKMEDWRMFWAEDFDYWRRLYTSHRVEFYCEFNQETWDVPSLEMTDEQAVMRDDVHRLHVSYYHFSSCLICMCHVL